MSAKNKKMLQNLEVSGNLSGIAERCEREGKAVFYRKEDLMLQFYEVIALK